MTLLPRVLLAVAAATPVLLAVGPGTANAASCDSELLKFGSEGQCVVEMKTLLNKNCTAATKLAGTTYYGEKTRVAVYNVQKLRFPDNKNRHTGMVGKNLWAAIKTAESKQADCEQPIDKDSVAAQQQTPAAADAATQLPAGVVAVWDKLAQCESTGNWKINTGNGYYGGLQFSLSTWRSYGGTGFPHEASKETQIRVAQKALAEQGPNAWPTCSKKAGLTKENGK